MLKDSLDEVRKALPRSMRIAIRAQGVTYLSSGLRVGLGNEGNSRTPNKRRNQAHSWTTTTKMAGGVLEV